MNRIKLDLIKQTTTVPIQQLKQITSCTPYSQGWLSQKFPIYPIKLNFHLSNPPFNRISIALKKPNIPKQIILQGSSDSKQYFKFAAISQFNYRNNGNGIVVLNLKQIHHYRYLRMKIIAPDQLEKMDSKSNICRQVWIRGFQLSLLSNYGCQYICSLQKALQLDPCLFRLLQLLQYKAILTKQASKQNKKQSQQYIFLSNKYYKDITEILTKLKQWKQNPKKLTNQARQNILQQIQILSKQPIQLSNKLQYNRQKQHNQVQQLQKQLTQFYVHRLNNLHKDVTDYFNKYWNKQIKQQYMRLLSSTDNQDHGKALSNFWEQVKKLQEFSQAIQEAIIMYFNYFLEYVHNPLKIRAIKILCLLFKNNTNLRYQIQFVYERLLFNLYSQLNANLQYKQQLQQQQKQQQKQLYEVSLKCIYTLFQKIPDTLFIQCLLNKQHSIKLNTKLAKLQILQKITFKNISIGANDRDWIVQYLLDILGIKQITLVDKNRAYNIIAYLATLYGKQLVMQKFEKLNTMITMNMEKIIDKKLQMIKLPKKQGEIPSCQYCGTVRESFADGNVYDLHCFKQCKYLTPCTYCHQVIEIPEMSKHYINNCQQRNIFKECEECNQVIVKIKELQHKKICTKVLSTKCGLCGEKMQGKLKLKEHILKVGCPNNPR